MNSVQHFQADRARYLRQLAIETTGTKNAASDAEVQRRPKGRTQRRVRQNCSSFADCENLCGVQRKYFDVALSTDQLGRTYLTGKGGRRIDNERDREPEADFFQVSEVKTKSENADGDHCGYVAGCQLPAQMFRRQVPVARIGVDKYRMATRHQDGLCGRRKSE